MKKGAIFIKRKQISFTSEKITSERRVGASVFSYFDVTSVVGGEVDEGVLAHLQLVEQVQQLAHGVIHLKNAEIKNADDGKEDNKQSSINNVINERKELFLKRTS